jgi:hypothetical protein
MFSADISSVGLAFDLIGGLLLWRYGLPESLHRDGVVAAVIYEINQDEKDKIKRYDFWAKIGILFLILGFLLQLAGSILGRSSSGALTGKVQSRPVAPSSVANESSAKFEPVHKP